MLSCKALQLTLGCTVLSSLDKFILLSRNQVPIGVSKVSSELSVASQPAVQRPNSLVEFRSCAHAVRRRLITVGLSVCDFRFGLGDFGVVLCNLG